MALEEMGKIFMIRKILKKDLTEPSLATELHYPVIITLNIVLFSVTLVSAQ